MVITPNHDGRASVAAVVTSVGVGLAVAVGRPGLAAFVAPFAVALLLGLRVRGPLEVGATVEVPNQTFLEGDEFTVDVEVLCRRDLIVSARLLPRNGLTTADGERGEFVLAPGERHATVRLRAVDWGRHPVGVLRISARVRGGLLLWEADLSFDETVRVLPRPVRVRELLHPAHARVVAGMHPSRAIGDGSDFAELRPWAPGDRVRHLNRQATARRRAPYVNRFHPDRSGEVVFLVDTFADRAGGTRTALQREAIARAARAAWALAQVHLAAQDRVGFLAYGRLGAWLPPGGGDRARFRLLATLLDLGGDVAGGTMRWGAHPERVLAPESLVVALTPLWRTQAVSTLQQVRRRGCTTVAIVIDTSDLAAPPAEEADALADRLHALQMIQRRAALAAAGVPEVWWPASGDLGTAVARLRALTASAR